MARKTMLRRSIAMLAVSGSLLAGGVVAATQAQAATNMVRLGTVEMASLREQPTAAEDADALERCKVRFRDRVHHVRYIRKDNRGTELRHPYTVFVYRCWGY